MSSSLSAKKSYSLPSGELPDFGDYWGNRMREINANSTSECLFRLLKSGSPSGDCTWNIEQNKVKTHHLGVITT